MVALAEKVREDYEIVKGIVTANQGDVMRVRMADGRTAIFTVKGAASAIGVGTDVGVVAHRGTEKAVFVVDRNSGQRFNTSMWHNHSFKSESPVRSVMRLVPMLLLLVPIFGQLVMLSGFFGALFSAAVVASSMKGHVATSLPRLFVATGAYFFGSFLFFKGWIGGDAGDKILGFLILAVAAAAYSFWVSRPATAFYAEVAKLADEAAA